MLYSHLLYVSSTEKEESSSQVAKKYTDKIRKEEAEKEQTPSPVSKATEEKLSQLNKDKDPSKQ
ncbi:hypothetical protein BDF14DRAFT_1844187 [Spinellus fusiger]|nr:hypothetical protein BDF14DRAFT_1844187 [Spinellus fusiger]